MIGKRWALTIFFSRCRACSGVRDGAAGVVLGVVFVAIVAIVGLFVCLFVCDGMVDEVCRKDGLRYSGNLVNRTS